MHCLVIHGSFRKGNTYKVTTAVMEHMKKLGECTFEEVFLKDMDLQFCIGCNTCFLKGESYCPHQNVIQSIAKKIETADILIVTSPTYSLAISSLVKCWIDHMSYRFHRPHYFHKRALVITTTVGAGALKTGRYIRDVLMHWGFNWVGRLAIQCASLDYHPDEKTQGRIEQTAQELYNEYIRKTLRKPSYKRVFYFNIWRAMALLGRDDQTADYCYWQEAKLQNTPFAPKVPLGAMKIALGNSIYFMLKKLMRLEAQKSKTN